MVSSLKTDVSTYIWDERKTVIKKIKKVGIKLTTVYTFSKTHS